MISRRSRILIVGVSGQVGYQLLKELYKQDKYELYGSYYTYDYIKTLIPSKINIKRDFLYFDEKFDIIYIPAYPTNVDSCEKSSTGREFNNKLSILLGKQLQAKVIFFSTDYVFSDGIFNETNFPCPKNEYGLNKFQMEHYILANFNNPLIIRTSGIYGLENQQKNFVYRVLSSSFVKIPIDQYNRPTYCPDLVIKTIKLVDENKSGIYHISGPDYLSRYGFAKKICKIFNIDDERLCGVDSKVLNQPAYRPSVNLTTIHDCPETTSIDKGLKEFYEKYKSGFGRGFYEE